MTRKFLVIDIIAMLERMPENATFEVEGRGAGCLETFTGVYYDDLTDSVRLTQRAPEDFEEEEPDPDEIDLEEYNDFFANRCEMLDSMKINRVG